MIPCIDALGAPRYKNAFFKIPRKFGVRSFATTFGDFFPLAKRWLETGGKTLGVNLIWEDDHKYGDQHIAKIKHLATAYNGLAIAYPDAKIELCTFTEHRLSNPDKYHDIAQNCAKNCTIVNSVIAGGAFSKRYKNEVHGSSNRPPIDTVSYNYSGDGGLKGPDPKVNENLVDCDIVKLLNKHKFCDRFYVWHARNNGRYSMKDTSPRPQRDFWPTFEMLMSQLYLFTQPEEVDLPPHWTIKSHSEHHGYNETKGDQLMIISPIRAGIIILKRDGKVIKKLKYYDKYEDGGYRYYSGGFGYKLGANLEIWIGSKQYGVFNGGFRAGTFRGKIL